MLLVKPSFEILYINPNPLELIERCGRTCYKSEDKITDKSSESFVKMLIKKEHLSVVEHSMMTVKFTVDRGVSHELVRHRLCAFSQESTRYCRYDKHITFIIPPWCENLIEGTYEDNQKGCLSVQEAEWLDFMLKAEKTYTDLLYLEWSPQQARSVLPNSLKTEIVVSTNLKEWRHILRLRCSPEAHPQMREIMIPLLESVRELIPVVFDDI